MKPSTTIVSIQVPKRPSAPSPMDNVLVLDNLLSWLILEDLLSARLVSRLWNSAALPFCQKRSCCKFKQTSKLRAFSKALRLTHTLPISNFRFQLGKIQSEDCAAFFVKYGSGVRMLEISDDWFDDSSVEPDSETGHAELEQYSNNFRILLSNAQNLEFLSLAYIPNGVYKHCLLEAKDLSSTKLFKLRVLKIASGPSFQPEFLSSLLALAPGLSCLDCMNVKFRAGAGPLPPMQRPRLRKLLTRHPAAFPQFLVSQELEALTLGCQSYQKSDDLYRFLALQQSSLRVLSLDLGLMTERVRIPEMHGLELLDCSKLTDQVSLLRLEPEQVPRLRKVLVSLKWGPDMFAEAEFSSVRELVLVDCPYSSSSQQKLKTNILKFGKLFPCLQKLSCNERRLKDSPLIALFSSFSQLTHLELRVHFQEFWFDLNLLFSGFPQTRRRKLCELIRAESPELFRLKPPFSSLPNLKRLTHLKLEFEASFGAFDITEVGVLLAFMRIPRLEKLTLSGKFSISGNDAEKLSGCHRHVLISPAPAYVPSWVSQAKRRGERESGRFSLDRDFWLEKEAEVWD